MPEKRQKNQHQPNQMRERASERAKKKPKTINDQNRNNKLHSRNTAEQMMWRLSRARTILLCVVLHGSDLIYN